MATEKPLPNIVTLTYNATAKGWAKFTENATVLDKAGYDLVSIVGLDVRLGKSECKSLGAVWRLARNAKQDKAAYSSFLDTADTDLVADDDY